MKKNSSVKTKHLSPADYVIHVFKGLRATARALEQTPASIVRWRKPLLKRGTGGKIPGQSMWKIMTLARVRKLDITANDLVFGRDVKVKNK